MLSCCANNQKWPIQEISPEEEKQLADLFALPVPQEELKKDPFYQYMEAQKAIKDIQDKYNLKGLAIQVEDSTSDEVIEKQINVVINDVVQEKYMEPVQQIVQKQQIEDVKEVIQEVKEVVQNNIVEVEVLSQNQQNIEELQQLQEDLTLQNQVITQQQQEQLEEAQQIVEEIMEQLQVSVESHIVEPEIKPEDQQISEEREVVIQKPIYIQQEKIVQEPEIVQQIYLPRVVQSDIQVIESSKDNTQLIQQTPPTRSQQNNTKQESSNLKFATTVSCDILPTEEVSLISQEQQKSEIVQNEAVYKSLSINQENPDSLSLSGLMVPMEMRKHEFQLKKSGYSLPPTEIVELPAPSQLSISQERANIEPYPGVIKQVVVRPVLLSPVLKTPQSVKSSLTRRSPQNEASILLKVDNLQKSLHDLESKIQSREQDQEFNLSAIEIDQNPTHETQNSQNMSEPTDQLNSTTEAKQTQTQTITYTQIKLLATPSNLLGYVNSQEIFSIPLLTLKIDFNDEKREIRIQKYKILSLSQQEYEKRKKRLTALQQKTDQPSPVLRIDLQNQKITLIAKNEAMSYPFSQIVFKQYVGVKSFLRMRASGVEFAYQGNESQVKLLMEKIMLGGGQHWE